MLNISLLIVQIKTKLRAWLLKKLNAFPSERILNYEFFTFDPVSLHKTLSNIENKEGEWVKLVITAKKHEESLDLLNVYTEKLDKNEAFKKSYLNIPFL